MNPLEITVENILKNNKKTVALDCHLIFKCEQFEIDMNTNCHRLDGKKILSDRYEEMYQTPSGVRVVAKKVGYNNGALAYFPAVQDEKGKFIADCTQPAVTEDPIKVICDKSTGLIARKDINHGIWFSQIIPQEALTNWLIEETYNIYSEDNSDSCLRIYDYLMETKQIGVYRFNPYGTTYNGFLCPQRINRSHFRLLLAIARVRIDKPEIAPTMVIQNAQMRANERARLDKLGTIAAIEEV